MAKPPEEIFQREWNQTNFVHFEMLSQNRILSCIFDAFILYFFFNFLHFRWKHHTIEFIHTHAQAHINWICSANNVKKYYTQKRNSERGSAIDMSLSLLKHRENSDSYSKKKQERTDFNLNPLKIYAIVCMTPYFMVIEVYAFSSGCTYVHTCETNACLIVVYVCKYECVCLLICKIAIWNTWQNR